VSLVSSPQLGWVVGSARPEAVALASIALVQRRTLALAVLAGLAAGLVGLLFARAVAGPVRALARAVRASARGGFTAPVTPRGAAELEALGLAFNEALAQLELHKRELRHRTQLQVRLSRHLPPSALHELLSQDSLQSRDAVEELVTVLYVDLVAGSDLSRAVEPHRLVDLLEELYAEACAAIEQHGGRVDRYSGDAVIGLFPASLVADPPRAGRAAAEDLLGRMVGLRARWAGEGLQVAVGMVSQTGHIVPAGDTAELTVNGALVEQAAALQQGAPAGTVAMDEASRRALSA
jgi:class 3 adenylate cyclase